MARRGVVLGAEGIIGSKEEEDPPDEENELRWDEQ